MHACCYYWLHFLRHPILCETNCLCTRYKQLQYPWSCNLIEQQSHPQYLEKNFDEQIRRSRAFC